MPEILLSPKERQALKARAHGIKPVVLLGHSGLSTPVLKEIDRALVAHELIKVRVPGDDREERDSVFAEVADALSAARVQAIGKLLVLYRPTPEAAEPTTAPARDRSAKAPRTSTATVRKPRGPGKPSAPKRTTSDRREVERVNRGTAARRDPGASMRAAGRRNAPPRRGGSRAR
jgi:putative YhbY family RNA-binding protein